MKIAEEALANQQIAFDLHEWKKGLNPCSLHCGADFKKCCKKYKKGKRCKKCPDR
jgi:hypothetical protein